MSTNTPAIPAGGSLAAIDRQAPTAERLNAAWDALTLVSDERCAKPIPAFMQHLPWADDDDSVVDSIIAQMLVSDDPDAMQTAGGTTKVETLVGRRVTIWDARVRPSDFDGGWGAYLLCDMTVDDEADHFPAAVGAKQALARIALHMVQAGLPMVGTFVKVAAGKSGHNDPLGFAVEAPLGADL